MPELSILIIQGFMNKIGEFSDSPNSIHWVGARVSPDCVVFSMAARLGR